MGDSTPLWKGGIITETERVFYVIRNIGYDQFVSQINEYGLGSNADTIDGAVQFSKFDDAVDAYAKHEKAKWMDLKYEIIKVTRKTTNSQPTRRVLGETEAAPEGAVVKYALTTNEGNDEWLNSPARASRNWLPGIDTAALFNSHRDVFRAFRQAQDTCARPNDNAYLFLEKMRIVRVALIPGGLTSNDTLTVLP